MLIIIIFMTQNPKLQETFLSSHSAEITEN